MQPAAVIETEHKIDTFHISETNLADKFLILAASNQVSKSEGVTLLY